MTHAGPGQVHIAEFDRWAEPLTDSVPRVLCEDLAAALPHIAVAQASMAEPESRQYRLSVTLSRFDGTLGDAAVLEVRWRLLGSEQQVLALRSSRFVEQTSGSGYGGLVAAMSRALGRLSQEIAAKVRSVPR